MLGNKTTVNFNIINYMANIAQFIKGQLIVGFQTPKIGGKVIEVILKNPILSELEEAVIIPCLDKITRLKTLSSLRSRLQKQEVADIQHLNEIDEYTREIDELQEELSKVRGPQPKKSDYVKAKVRVIRQLNVVEANIVKEIANTSQCLHLAELVGKLPRKFRKPEPENKTSEPED